MERAYIPVRKLYSGLLLKYDRIRSEMTDASSKEKQWKFFEKNKKRVDIHFSEPTAMRRRFA